ncbi:transposase [Corynebacterium meridianum]|uniref:Transposase n=1 Tax=Corynebacterium meridianum TaxID=2765363 RepID=A0A934I4M8_9CORY|nr:transposase [Corynebacterium meridianum]
METDRCPFFPSNAGRQGYLLRDYRKVVEGIIYRYRVVFPLRDLPREEFGPWQTVWKAHVRCTEDRTWYRVCTRFSLMWMRPG